MRQLFRLLAIVVATLVLGAACGGSNDESTNASEPDSGEPAPDADEADDDASIETGDAASDDVPADRSVELTATDTGVTESVIKVGAVFPDTSLIGRDPGDIEAKFQTIADAINDAGGINGRMIELHVRLTNPLDDSDWERVCVELTEDVGVFAAIGLFVRTNADCYAGLNDTIVVSNFGITAEQMAGYTAPALTIPAHPERLIEGRVAELVNGGVLAEGTAVAVVGGQQGADQQQLYFDALSAAGIDVVADTLILNDAQDQLALSDEMATLTEVWKSSGAEAVLASAGLVAQSFLIAYNENDIDLPMILPQGLSVPPSLIQDQLGIDVAPFEFATALVEGDSAPVKYEKGADGVRACVDAFTAASGEEVALDESRDNLEVTVVACQAFDIFVPIAEAAGVDLTTESFRDAAEAFGPIEITNVGEASVGPDKFDLSDAVGTIATFDPDTVQFVPVD